MSWRVVLKVRSHWMCYVAMRCGAACRNATQHNATHPIWTNLRPKRLSYVGDPKLYQEIASMCWSWWRTFLTYVISCSIEFANWIIRVTYQLLIMTSWYRYLSGMLTRPASSMPRPKPTVIGVILGGTGWSGPPLFEVGGLTPTV